MALVSIHIIDGPDDNLIVNAAIEPGVKPGEHDGLTPAQQLGVHVLDALKEWLDAAEKAEAEAVILPPRLYVPGAPS